MKQWFFNVREAAGNWLLQSFISWDQALGNTVLGFAKVVTAAFTAKPQTPIWADETVSAHLYRAARARKPIAEFVMPIVDRVFALWQGEDPGVNEAAGRSIANHCERAWWKEKLRRGLPPEERNI